MVGAMGWYDLFSSFYDSSLERLYVTSRASAAAALDLAPGQAVLDLPCGTGQAFDTVAPALLPGGVLVGVDASEGMLGKARARAARQGWSHVHALPGDVRTLSAATVAGVHPSGQFDRALIFLGLTAFPDWEASFGRVWALLRPGGRCVVVDVHAAQPGFQGRMVNLVARADIRRQFWVPLEQVAQGFERRDLPSLPDHGGQLILATGTKPGG